jgi:hypothetical protein
MRINNKATPALAVTGVDTLSAMAGAHIACLQFITLPEASDISPTTFETSEVSIPAEARKRSGAASAGLPSLERMTPEDALYPQTLAFLWLIASPACCCCNRTLPVQQNQHISRTD